MVRVGFTLQVRAELLNEYKERHEQVWPEMLDALRRHGWHNYSLFLRSDGVLFGYFETPRSFEGALESMANEEINGRWQADMAHFFEGAGDPADEMMTQLVEVFHLD